LTNEEERRRRIDEINAVYQRQKAGDDRTLNQIDSDREAKKQERTLRRIGLNLIRAVKRCQ
jgi:hypothetical protein